MAANNMPQKKEDDYITNKVLAVFSLCLGGVLALMGVERLVSKGTTFLAGMMLIRVLLGLAVVGVLVGVYLIAREKKKNINTNLRILTGRNVTMVFLVALVILGLTYYYVFPIFKVFYALLPALAVYYLIYHSYQPEFFVVAVDGGIAIVLLMIARRAMISTNVQYLTWVALAVMVVVLLIQFVMVFKVRANQGKLTFAGKEYEFQFSNHAYTMMRVTPVIMTALVAVGVCTTTSIALYAVFAAAAYLFVSAVYYTVKLM